MFSLGESVKLLIPSFCWFFFFFRGFDYTWRGDYPWFPSCRCKQGIPQITGSGLVLQSIEIYISGTFFLSTHQLSFPNCIQGHILAVNLFQGCLWSTYLLFFMVTCWINLQHICIGTKVIVIFLFFIVLFDSFGWQSISQG